jgi:signal transduction histidine kinase
MKNDFISMAAHELKTPLISISGYIDLILMREENLKKEIKSDLKRSMSNVKRLKEYINQLMDVMKIDAKKMELIKRDTPLNTIIEDIISELELQIKEKNLEIKNSISEDIIVYVDQFRIKQVISNLLSNAIKFSYENGNIEIDVEENKNEFLISIKDEGIGLKRSEIDKLFGKFVMLKNIEKFSRGSGLGLYIAKGIVERHGGFIEARSEGENKGSKFIFSIPK